MPDVISFRRFLPLDSILDISLADSGVEKAFFSSD